jgi:predicted metal-binding membrane protein
MAVLAWIVLFWMHVTTSPHHMHGHSSMLLNVMRHQEDDGRLTFLFGWFLMTVAMMLPTILPIVESIRRQTRGWPGKDFSLFIMLSGYLSVWLAVGVLLLFLRSLATQLWPALAGYRGDERLVAGGLFLIAGIFQFLPLKHRCLEKCRAPLSCAAMVWPGERPILKSLQLGLRHGIVCAGCCWALMLLMFAVGSAHMLWMMVLTVLMATEKNLRWGQYLTKPLGACLLLGAAFLFFA